MTLAVTNRSTGSGQLSDQGLLLLEMSEGTKPVGLGPEFEVRPVRDFFAVTRALLAEAAGI